MKRMPRAKVKKWDHISGITEQWVKDSYANCNKATQWKLKNILNTFFEFMDTTDAQFIEGYKKAKDRNEWARQIGFKVVTFYNERLKLGYSTNTARAEASAVRAFCRDNCTTLLLPRKKIAKAKEAHGEHEFSLSELAKMFYVADVRGKAILSTAICLGFSVEDFSELKRIQIESLVNKAIAEKIDFIGFDYERGKTGVQSRSHITPEARDSLKAWFEYVDQKRQSEGKPKSEWIWPNGNGNHLTDQALNDVIKDLVQKANVITTGTIRFHLIRKFTMNALHDAGFSEWEVKKTIGKEIPTTDSTYLHGLSRKVDEKFHEVYPFIRLAGYANRNHIKIEELEQKLGQMESNLEAVTLEKDALYRIIEFSIPKDVLRKALLQAAKTLPTMTEEKLNQIENLLQKRKKGEQQETGLQNAMTLFRTRKNETKSSEKNESET
jgi:hypothetical protein